MLYELIETDANLQLIFGLALGLVFGVAAQISRFCLRRAVAGETGAERSNAAAVWLAALGTAIAGFAIATATGWAQVEDHRYLATDIPLAALVLGGLAFGAGMVLTRGCASRLTVLSATGNLRAVVVLAVFALVAHAALKGVLAPLRVALGSVTVEAPLGSLAQIPGFAALAALAVLAAAVLLAQRSGASWLHMGLGAVVGLVAVGGWVLTSVVILDEFDPAPIQSAAFTSPWADTLFWTIASTALPAGFGVGFIGGVLGGSFLSAAARGELALQGFDGPHDMLRYGAGGALMGMGGVLAGGCTVGAGLGGGAMLGVSALIALAMIVLGAVATRAVLQSTGGKRALA